MPSPIATRPAILLLLLIAAPCASAAWFDAAWPYRREVNINWEAEKSTGGELALAEVLTAGHHKADGSDVRVATDDGRVVASRLLGVGPGDQVRVVFALVKGQRKYAVYFGHPNPPAKAKGADDLPITSGLLLDMRVWPGGAVDRPDAMLAAWGRAKGTIGQTMIPTLFTGKCPFGDAFQWISKISGTIYTPLEGEFIFAVAAKDKGMLMIDGKMIVFCPHLVGDTRFNGKVVLTKGKHELTFYHVNAGGEGVLSVVWQKPDSSKFELIPRDALGGLYTAMPAALEENRKTLTADFKAEYMGEAFFAGHFSHRYRFTANLPKTQPPKYEWDLGDGQTAEGNIVEHVYLAEGIYPIKLTARIAANNDTQTTQFSVVRDVSAERPKVDDVAVQSKVVEAERLDKIPVQQLPWALLLHERAGRLDPMIATAARLASLKSGFDASLALSALSDANRAAEAGKRAPDMVKVWASIPADSSMQPAASRVYANLLVWRVGDFDQACKVLAAHDRSKDRPAERLYAHALVLNQKYAEGKKRLEALPMEGPADRQAAISGAEARTIEYYIQQGEGEAGEDQWDRWQRQYPTDFLEGYSVLLRVRLIEVRKQPDVAAKVAEAFALAVPRSSYAPTLLDRASKLLEMTNPAKSAELRKLLKEKYPEDPLSQEKKEGGK